MKFKDIFIKPKDLGKRIWGKEILLALVEGKYTFKKLEMNAGSKGNLQYHHKKTNVILAFRKIIIKI